MEDTRKNTLGNGSFYYLCARFLKGSSNPSGITTHPSFSHLKAFFERSMPFFVSFQLFFIVFINHSWWSIWWTGGKSGVTTIVSGGKNNYH